MSIVPDQHDVQGMFSKAGRFTSEKYIIFSKKDEILTNKSRKVYANLMPEIPEKQDKPQTNIPKTKSVDLTDKKFQKTQIQPFSKQISRDKIQKIHIDKNQPPPCGYYHPKHSEIDPQVHHLFDYEKTQLKMHSRVNKALKEPEPFENVPERMRQSRTCLYEIERQKPREYLFKGMPQPHEKRFEFVNVNEVWSKVPRVPQVPSMEKVLARDQMIIYKKKQYAPDYDPNHEYGKKQLGSCGAPFEKIEKRKNLFLKPCPYTNETIFEWDKYSKSDKSIYFKRVFIPDFSRMLTREQNSDSKLPSFMQKFVNSRMTLTCVHQKMLEENNYGVGRFQTVTSGFGLKKKEKKVEESFSDEEMEQQMDQQEQ